MSCYKYRSHDITRVYLNNNNSEFVTEIVKFKGIVMSRSDGIDRLILVKENPIDDTLKERWISIEEMENTFRYKLNVEKRKVIPGKYQFFVEVRRLILSAQISQRSKRKFQFFSTIHIVQHYDENHK